MSCPPGYVKVGEPIVEICSDVDGCGHSWTNEYYVLIEHYDECQNPSNGQTVQEYSYSELIGECCKHDGV